MAWYKRYMIPFCSRTGTNLCVYIFEQTSGTLTTLTPAAEPFYTRENDSDDVFMPIRTQTGYVRVIDDIGGTLMQTIMPDNNLQKKVELWSGTYNAANGTFSDSLLKWRGFLKAEAFTQPWDSQKNVIEFAIIDVLEALYSKQIETESFYINRNVAWLLSSAFSDLGTTPSNVYLRSDLSSPLYHFAAILLQLQVFSDEEDIINQGDIVRSVSGMTYGNAIEKVMTFYGLTMREDADNIYMAQYDGSGITLMRYTWSNITSIANGSQITPSEQTLPSVDMLSALSFRGANNEHGMAQGYKTFIVNLAISNNSIELEQPYVTCDASTVYEVEITQDANHTVYAQPHPGIAGSGETFTYLQYDNYTYQSTSDYATMLSHTVLTGYTMNPYYSHDTPVITGAFPVRWYNRTAISDVIRLQDGLYLNTQSLGHTGSSNHSKNLCYSVKSSGVYDLTAGFLNFNAHLDTFRFNSDNGQRTYTKAGDNIQVELYIAIRVGSLFWDNSLNTWTSGTALTKYFAVHWNDGTLETNKTQDIVCDATDGFFIPISNTITGDMEVYIINCSYTCKIGQTAQALRALYHIMSDIKLKHYANGSITESNKNSNIYRTTAGNNNFRETREIYVDIGTMNNNHDSCSFIKDRTGAWIEAFLYGSANIRPEMHLLSRLAAQYSVARHTYKAITANVINIPPTIYTYDGKKFLGVDARHNWRDDEQEVKFIEVD